MVSFAAQLGRVQLPTLAVATGVVLVLSLVDDVHRLGVVVALTHAKHDLLADLGRTGILERIGREHVFPTNPTAVDAFREATAAGGP